ncbi:response regulator [Burkholderiaceae bacterium DAT-1]|nr:response regulator [Burkholderiaceae bacterium DAT-1]
MASASGGAPKPALPGFTRIDDADDDRLAAFAAGSISIDYAQKRVLVVDAVQEMRTAMGNTLATLGINKVEYAHRATDAIATVRRADFDIIFCDYDLGSGYDGLHLLQELRLHNLLKPSVVFVMVTGERRGKLVMSAAEQAPDGYLLKPFTAEQVKHRLDKLLVRKREFQSLDQAMLRQDYFKALAECNDHLKSSSPYVLDYLKMKGNIALTIGDNQLAKTAFDAARELKDLPWVRIGLGKALFGLKQYDEARSLFQSVLAENNKVMEAYDWLARIYLAEHHADDAQQILSKAVDMSPAVVNRQKKLGDVALKNHDFSTAAKSFRDAITLSKNSFWRDAADYVSLSKAQIGNGDTEDALKTAAEVRREFRGDTRASMLATLVECKTFLAQGQTDRANATLDKARQLADESTGLPDHFVLELAETCYQLDRDHLGKSLVQQILRNHHEDSDMLERINSMYEAVGREDEGQQVIEESARAIVAINNEAVRMAQSGNLEGAVEKFIHAVDEMPANVSVMLNAVNALLAYVGSKGWHQRYMTLAREYLDRVAALQPASVKYLKLKDAYAGTMKKFSK